MNLSFAKPVLDVLYPRSCTVCEKSLQGTPNNGICWDCRSNSAMFAPPWCEVCGGAVAGRLDHHFICVDCEEDPPEYIQARSLFRYEGGIREAIHGLKYQRDFSVIPDLARMLVAGVRTHFDTTPGLVLVPVPLHWRRHIHRQFNQGEELIRGMRKLDPQLTMWKGLKRTRHTDTQTRLSKAGRKANVRNAFAVSSTKPVPERVLLIDDVMTTGATLNSASRALKKAGVLEVTALTLARG